MKPTWPFREKHFFPTIAYHGIHTRPRIGGFSYKNSIIQAPYLPRQRGFSFSKTTFYDSDADERLTRPPQRGFSFSKNRFPYGLRNGVFCFHALNQRLSIPHAIWHTSGLRNGVFRIEKFVGKISTIQAPYCPRNVVFRFQKTPSLI
jgi:hypothetical protein